MFKENGMVGKPTYKEKGARVEVVCGNCKAKIDLSNYRFGDKVICPKCGKQHNK